MADTKLNIVIAAKDSASAVLGAVGAKLSGIKNAVGSGLGSIASPFTGIAAKMAAVAGGAVSMGAAFKMAHDSIEKASEFEDIKTSFVTLLGSTDAAQKRMEELSKFAASTPFDIPGVARASKTLETLTRGALSTGPGLTLVGDVAASTGTQFDEMAVTIGRAYDGLTSGRAVGESLQRLQELGTLSGTTRAKLEQMQASGQKGAAVWGVLAKELGRFGGEMDRRSATFSGKMSNMKDAWDSLQRAFGEPVIDALKPLLDDLGAWFEKLKPAAAEFGQKVAGAIELVRKAFADGTLWGKVGETISIVFTNAASHLENQLKAAFRVAIATLWAGVLAVGDSWKDIFSGGDFINMDRFMSDWEKRIGESEMDLNPPSLASWIDATKSQLAEVWGNLPVPEPKKNQEVAKAVQTASGGLTDHKIAKAEVDSLAKVGLFAGGSAPALNYARRTADGIDRVAKGIDKLVQRAARGGDTGASFA